LFILPLYTNFQTKHVRTRTTSMRNIKKLPKRNPPKRVLSFCYEVCLTLSSV